MQGQLDILRRIAERGLKLSHKFGWSARAFTDIFQHLLDEIERAKKSAGLN